MSPSLLRNAEMQYSNAVMPDRYGADGGKGLPATQFIL
jgi:hypothetical protein